MSIYKHTIEDYSPNVKTIEWDLKVSHAGWLVLKANGNSVVGIDPYGKITLFREGTKLGLDFGIKVGD
jgi:hypothetical protein